MDLNKERSEGGEKFFFGELNSSLWTQQGTVYLRGESMGGGEGHHSFLVTFSDGRTLSVLIS